MIEKPHTILSPNLWLLSCNKKFWECQFFSIVTFIIDSYCSTYYYIYSFNLTKGYQLKRSNKKKNAGVILKYVK